MAGYVVCVHMAGFPNEEIYGRLCHSMRNLGFDRRVVGETEEGVLKEITLPPATFWGRSELASDELACGLSKHLKKAVWSDALVFAVQVNEWAMV